MFKPGDRVRVVNRNDHWDGLTGTIKKKEGSDGLYILDMDDYPERCGRAEFPYAHFFQNKLELVQEVITLDAMKEDYGVD
jgi:hypothetical protein